MKTTKKLLEHMVREEFIAMQEDEQEAAAGAAPEDNVQQQHAAAVKIINAALDRITTPQSWAAIAPVVVKKISELAPAGQDVSWLVKAFGESAGRRLAKEIGS